MLVRPMPVEAVRLNPRTGLPEINTTRGKVQSWAQGTQQNAGVSIDSNGTASDAIVVQPEKGLSGDFEVVAFTSDSQGNYRVELYVGGGTNKRLMNVPIHVDLIAGAAGLPFYLPAPLFVEARNAISIRYTNLVAITNRVRFVAHGRRFLDYASDLERKQVLQRAFARQEVPFWLGLNDTSVTLTSSQTNVRRLMSVPSDGDFEAEYLVARSQGPVRVFLRESSSGRPIMAGGGSTLGVQGSHVLGNALYPYRFPNGAAFFKRQTEVEVYLDDLSAASNAVEIALVGRLLDYPEARDREPVPEPPSAVAVAASRPIANSASFARTVVPVEPKLTVSPLERKKWWS